MDEEDEKYTMGKNLIIEAWAKYRPESRNNSPRDDGEGSPMSPQRKNIG